jgi:hypothetical protein
VTDPHVIVWDLDNTLGDFSALHRQGDRTKPIRVRIRPGLADALAELSRAGFVHTLLTLATPLYAEVALRGTGLFDAFARVEGLGQRGKGDAAGVAAALGIPDEQRPHRMLFVGDHPLFDEPRDPRVVFHLEPLALTRPADQLTRLVLHLRDTGSGSLRRGFDHLHGNPPWWRRLWPVRADGRAGPVRRTVPGAGDVALLRRPDACPVIGFATAPEPPAVAAEHDFVPAALTLRVRAGLP